MGFPVINTREDLDAIAGSYEHFQFMEYLRGTLTRKVDTAERPADYGQDSYAGEVISPVWQDIEDTSVIERFGFSKEDFAGEDF